MGHVFDKDTAIGGASAGFPATRMSAVRAARSDDAAVREAGVESLLMAYWKPVYKYIRIKWRASNESAKDLVQGFFVDVLARDLLQRYDPAKAAFRTYLRLCLDGYLSNEQVAAGRQKRGGDARFIAMEFEQAEAEIARSGEPASDAEEYFRREWVRHIFTEAVEMLRRQCEAGGRMTQFALFARYDLAEPDARQRLTYEILAREFELPATQVTNHLAWARREFRRLAMDVLRAATGSDDEYREEARLLFGVEPP